MTVLPGASAVQLGVAGATVAASSEIAGTSLARLGVAGATIVGDNEDDPEN